MTLAAAVIAASAYCSGCPIQCSPDINGDDTIDALDLIEIIANWGDVCGDESDDPICTIDITGDGIIDAQDLVVVLVCWEWCENNT